MQFHQQLKTSALKHEKSAVLWVIAMTSPTEFQNVWLTEALTFAYGSLFK